MMKKKCGIYQIRNLANGKLYIGQSIDLYSRMRAHLNNLRGKRHRNSHLQRSYDKYGEKFFEFKIIEECSSKLLDDREIYWVEYYSTNNGKYGYNIQSGGNKIMSQKDKNMKTRNRSLKFDVRCENEIMEIIELLNSDKNMSMVQIAQEMNVSVYIVQRVNDGYYHSFYNNLTEVNYTYNTSGKNNPNVTPRDKVIEIIELINNRLPVKIIRKKLNCSKYTFYRVKNGEYSDIYDDLPQINKLHGSLLPKEKILKIIELLNSNKFTQRRIAKNVDVGKDTIIKIINGYYGDVYDLPEITYHTYSITKEIVLNVSDLLISGMAQAEIAKNLKIGEGAVGRIKSGVYNERYNLPEINFPSRFISSDIKNRVASLLREGFSRDEVRGITGIAPSSIRTIDITRVKHFIN